MPVALAVTVYWLRVKVAVTLLPLSRLEKVQVAVVAVPPVAVYLLHTTVEPVAPVAVRVMALPWSRVALSGGLARIGVADTPTSEETEPLRVPVAARGHRVLIQGKGGGNRPDLAHGESQFRCHRLST